jgi:hypothetical protein
VTEVPLGVVTVIFTGPAAAAGDVAIIKVGELTEKEVAGTLPKSTAVAPVKLVPVIETKVPPKVLP